MGAFVLASAISAAEDDARLLIAASSFRNAPLLAVP